MAVKTMTPRLTLGPIQYFWDADTKRDFYARILRIAYKIQV